MRTKDLWILLALTGLLAGCGQKGPLVLPDAQHPRKKLRFPATPGTAQPAPADRAETPANPPGTSAAPPDAPSGDHSTPDQAPRP